MVKEKYSLTEPIIAVSRGLHCVASSKHIMPWSVSGICIENPLLDVHHMRRHHVGNRSTIQTNVCIILNYMTKLTPDLLLRAYTTGHFPMSDGGMIRWYNPNPRGIIPLDERFHVPSRLGRTYRSGRYQLTSDQAFTEVMRACALPRPQQPETWIDDHFIDVYTQLHHLGYAHSIETWQDGQLVGGLYGVAIGGLFAGESMFSMARDASKVALIELVSRLRRGGFVLLDTQWVTEHLAQFGTFWMPQSHYLHHMQHAILQRTVWIHDERR